MNYSTYGDKRELDIGEKVILLIPDFYGYQGTIADKYMENSLVFIGYYVITDSPFDKHHIYVNSNKLIPLVNP